MTDIREDQPQTLEEVCREWFRATTELLDYIATLKTRPYAVAEGERE